MRKFIFNLNGQDYYNRRAHFAQPVLSKSYSNFTPRLATHIVICFYTLSLGYIQRIKEQIMHLEMRNFRLETYLET
jgi:hypothetical protein